MRATLVVGLLLSGCAAPVGSPAGSPIVGHLRLRDRVIDLSVASLTADRDGPELRDMTASRAPLVWAGTDERVLTREATR